jgi:undecaprenyl-diphosphatase
MLTHTLAQASLAAPAAHAALPIWQAVVLGVVEGITEYLPISSTGHLIIAASLMRGESTKHGALDEFLIVIQVGAILAVAFLYWRDVQRMALGLLGKSRFGLRLAINLLIAFCPAAVAGVLLDDVIGDNLMKPWPVIAALFVGGIFMIFLERWRRTKHADHHGDPHGDQDLERMKPWQALTVGLMQLFALWPGTSRSMMTIAGGLVAGLRPAAAARFSFLLGMITLTAAGVYVLLHDFYAAHKSNQPMQLFALGVVPIVVGIVVAGVSAFLAVKWLVGFLTRHGLTPFGYYRIAVALVLALMAWRGVLKI